MLDDRLLDWVIPINQEVTFLDADFVRSNTIRGKLFRDVVSVQPGFSALEHTLRTQVICNFQHKYSALHKRRGMDSVEAWMMANEDWSEYAVFKSIGNPIQHEDYSFMIKNQILAYKDVEEVYEAEQIHSFNEQHFRNNHHNWLVWCFDDNTGLHSRRLHQDLGLAYGRSHEVSGAFFQLFPIDLLSRLKDPSLGISGRLELTIEHEAESVTVAVHYHPLLTNRAGLHYLFVIRQLIQRPKKIPFTSDLYKSVINSAGVDLCVFDLDHHYLFINEHAIKDKSIREWIIGKTDFDYCAFRNIDMAIARRRRETFLKCIESKETQEIEEFFENKSKGTYAYSLKRYKPIIIDNEVQYVIGYGLDITSLKDSEHSLAQSEARYRDLFETSLDLIQTTTPSGELIYCNNAWQETLGYSMKEISGRELMDLVSEEQRESLRPLFLEVLAGRTLRGIRLTLLSQKGTKLEMEGNLVPRLENGIVTMVHTFLRDITERKEREALLKQSLAEKESLLGEIHHRVKNNLTVVYSLLELQGMKETNEKLQRAFKESQTRIKAMALVHEKLYRSNDFSRIEIKSYLSDLVAYIIKAIDGNGLKIQSRITGDAVSMNIRHAVPCGLLLNEIVTNSCKYAFINHSNPELLVEVSEQEEYSKIKVKDNGPGLPADFNPAVHASLGMRLIKTFVSQLKGEMKIINQNGLLYEITIPHHESTTSRR